MSDVNLLWDLSNDVYLSFFFFLMSDNKMKNGVAIV